VNIWEYMAWRIISLPRDKEVYLGITINPKLTISGIV